MPESYLRDPEVFPEKEGDVGSIYIEAADKVTLKKIRDITFINARDILGIIYVSKSGNSRLKWRQTRGKVGKVSGEASTNSLVNLFTARVLTKDYTEKLMKGEVEVVKEEVAEELEEASIEEAAEISDGEEGASSSSETPDSGGSPRIDADV